MTRKIGLYLLDDPEQAALVIHDAVEEGMFYIEHLLVEIEGLQARVEMTCGGPPPGAPGYMGGTEEATRG